MPADVDKGASGMKIELRISPQKINTRFSILSAKNPKIGCNNDEKMLYIHVC